MQASAVPDDTLFDLGKLTNYLFSQWKWLVLLGFGFAAIFAAVSVYLPNQYTSETVLVAAESGSGGLDGLSGQLGGLASLAGLNLDSGKDKTVLALQILQSRQFLIKFVKRHRLEVPLFAVERWDHKNDRFIYDEDKYHPADKKWLRHSDGSRSYYPTDLEIHEELKTLLNVDVDKPNQVTRITLSYYHPAKAQQWLAMLIQTLNNTMRQTDIDEKETQIAFLQQQLTEQSNTDIRNVFYSLIEEQLKSSTLAKARDEYVFRVIDPALLPEEKSSPKRALNTVLGGLVGGVLYFIFFAIRFIFKS